MRLIDVDHLLNGFDVRKVTEYDESGCGFEYKAVSVKAIEDAPTIEAEPVRHARWLPTNDDNKKRCSRCDVIHLIAQYPHGQANYCPNCGAKMDAEVHDDA